jgi:hypothetical protein
VFTTLHVSYFLFVHDKYTSHDVPAVMMTMKKTAWGYGIHHVSRYLFIWIQVLKAICGMLTFAVPVRSQNLSPRNSSNDPLKINQNSDVWEQQWTINTNYIHGAEPFSRSRQLCSYSRTAQHFMEPESSLPCSQEPSIGPYLEPDQSSPYHPIVSNINFNIIHTYVLMQ